MSSGLGGFVLAALIAAGPVAVKADGNATAPGALLTLGPVVSHSDTRLLLQAGAAVNYYGIELPFLQNKKESALRRRFFQQEILGKTVRLDNSAFSPIKLDRNRYGDFLGKIHIGGKWLQQYLLSRGWARLNGEYPYPETILGQLRQAESEARRRNRGLWGEEKHALLQSDKIGKPDYQFHLVEGRVVKVVKTRATTYINFGADWRTDFTAAIGNSRRRNFRALAVSLPELVGRKLRLRGWIRSYNGPFMELESWTQVELLDSE